MAKKPMTESQIPDSTSSTVIGETVVIKGKIKTGEDLVIKGRIEAEINSEKALFVENSGIVKADVNVRTARINGIVVGNVFALDKIELAADGRLIGDLTSPRIIISDGAAFRGKIDMPTAEEAQKRASQLKTGTPKGPQAPGKAEEKPNAPSPNKPAGNKPPVKRPS